MLSTKQNKMLAVAIMAMLVLVPLVAVVAVLIADNVDQQDTNIATLELELTAHNPVGQASVVKTCGKCNETSPEDNNFCVYCGAKLPEAVLV